MTIKKPQTATLIDMFSEGYAAVNRRPWLVLIPILLNVYIWFGTQLSFAPLINDLYTLMRANSGTTEQSSLPAQSSEQLRELSRVDMRQDLARLNFIPTLTMYMIAPGDAAGSSGGVPLPQYVPPQIIPDRHDTIEVSGVGGALLAFLLLNALALPLSAVFLTQLAEAVRGDPNAPATGVRRAWRAMLAILGCVAAIVGVGLALGLPFLFLCAMLVYFSPALGLFMLGMLLILVFWISIYLGFANEAIVISGIGPLRALHASFNIVRRNFWATLGFLAISYLITVGSGVLWLNLAQQSTVGLIVAIAGSAYLGSGLLAARMAFYRERLRRWQGAVAPARPS